MTVERRSVDPSRRHLLRMGALAVGGGGLLLGCSSDEPDPDPALPPAGQDETEAEPERGPEVDVSLLNTALSLEVLTVDTYQAALDFSLIESRALVAAATLFQQHHRAHRDVLVAAVEAAEGEPFTTANPVVKAALVDPSLVSVATERDFVTLARDLEQAAAQLYVHATTQLSSPELRSTAMSIGAVASRRATVLDLMGDLGNERLATFPTDNPLPSDAVVGN